LKVDKNRKMRLSFSQNHSRIIQRVNLIIFEKSPDFNFFMFIYPHKDLYKHLSARVSYPPQEGNQQISPSQPVQGVKRDNANGSDNSHAKTHDTDQTTKASK